MTVDEIADILYDYLKRKQCPVCCGNIRVEVHRRTRKPMDDEEDRDPLVRHLFRVVCRGECGGFVDGDDFARFDSGDLPEDPIFLRGLAEKLWGALRTTDKTIGDEVAKRLMKT